MPTSLSAGVPERDKPATESHEGPDETNKVNSSFELSISSTSTLKSYITSSSTEGNEEVKIKGASFIGFTVNKTSASLASSPSLTTKVKLSLPLKLSEGT